MAAVNDCISSIESEFKHIVIANRFALYRNFVDTYHDLKTAVYRKLNTWNKDEVYKKIEVDQFLNEISMIN